MCHLLNWTYDLYYTCFLQINSEFAFSGLGAASAPVTKCIASQTTILTTAAIVATITLVFIIISANGKLYRRGSEELWN